jgi:cytochrome c biogenesis protein CcmG, thiol:disulfide interchange protein DsbE
MKKHIRNVIRGHVRSRNVSPDYRRTATLVIVAAALVFCFVGCPKNSGRKPAQSGTLSIDNVTFTGMDGRQISLKTLADGKPLYVTFSASWCKVCIGEVEVNNRIYDKFGKLGLKMYGVNVGEDLETVNKFIKANKVNYPMVRDPGQKAAQTLQMIGLPLNLVYDASGKEIYRDAAPPSEDVLQRIAGGK